MSQHCMGLFENWSKNFMYPLMISLNNFGDLETNSSRTIIGSNLNLSIILVYDQMSNDFPISLSSSK